MRPMMTFLRINLERRFCASKWRKFQEKNASFFSKWTCEIIIIYRDIKKEEERERRREDFRYECVEWSCADEIGEEEGWSERFFVVGFDRE